MAFIMFPSCNTSLLLRIIDLLVICAWPTRTQTNSEIHCKYVKHRCNGCVVSCGGQKKKFMLPVQDVALKGHQQV